MPAIGANSCLIFRDDLGLLQLELQNHKGRNKIKLHVVVSMNVFFKAAEEEFAIA